MLAASHQKLQERAKHQLLLELFGEDSQLSHERGNVLLVSHKATLRVISCALLGLDVRLFRERIAQPVAAVTMFVVTNTTAQLTILGDRSHLSEDLKNQEGT